MNRIPALLKVASAVLFLSLLTVVWSCESSDEPGGDLTCSELAKSQVLSEPCCPDYGVDACGAGLFCAAFDGRAQPTCYEEHSRLDGTECSEDRQCASQSCNLAVRKCRSLPNTRCVTDIGCADDSQGRHYGCDLSGEEDVCRALGNGGGWDVCETNADCGNGQCSPELKRCLCGEGEPCDASCGYEDGRWVCPFGDEACVAGLTYVSSGGDYSSGYCTQSSPGDGGYGDQTDAGW